MLLQGIYTALYTPFKKDDNSIDYDSLNNLIVNQMHSDIAGFVVYGSTAECASLNISEYLDILKFITNKVDKKVKIIANIGLNDSYKTIQMFDRIKHMDIDYYLAVCPYYNKPNQEGLLKHFTYIADYIDKPLIIYNVSSRTSVDISVSTIYKLSKHKNIIGIKECSTDFNKILELIYHQFNDFSLLSGDDLTSFSSIFMGFQGLVSVVSNIIPNEIVSIYSDIKNNKLDSAKLKFKKYYNLIDILSKETNPILLKRVMYFLRKSEFNLRLPLVSTNKYDIHINKIINDISLV